MEQAIFIVILLQKYTFMDRKELLGEMLQHAGISQLNKMQEQMLKGYGGGGNVVLLSPTGSGKTLAYLLPLMLDLMERMTAGKEESNEAAVQAVVLVPSRELALQTEKVFKSLGTSLRAVSLYGGRPTMDEHRTMRGVKPHVVIATPGRMNDHLQKGNIQAGTVRVLVIDEFDKCLELGFRDEMGAVIKQLPKLRRRVLLSATDAEEIPSFVKVREGDACSRVDFLGEGTPGEKPEEKKIVNYIARSEEKDKLGALLRLLGAMGGESCLVFVNYRDAVDRVGKFLKQEGVYCELFHGGMEQKDRERALYKFANGSCNVFVSTDLAARGLDIPDIDHVIHYHLPVNEEAYTHRNGRTARWMAKGSSYLLLGPEETVSAFLDEEELLEFELPVSVDRPKAPKWITLYIGKGKKDKVSKIDILGFLCQKGGLSKDDVGRIDVMDHQAYVAVSRQKHRDVLQKVQGEKIKRLKTLIQVTR